MLLPFRGGKEAAVPTAPRRITGRRRQAPLHPAEPAGGHRLVHRGRDARWRVPGPILVAHRVREQSRFGDLVTGYPWNPLRTEVVVPTAVQDPAVATR